MENPGACLCLSLPVALQDVVYRRGNADAHCIFFRQLFRIEPENRYSPYDNNDVWLDGFISIRKALGSGIIGEISSMHLCVEVL